VRWPFPDPAGKDGTDEEQLQRFRDARDGIRKRQDFKVLSTRR
jgi:hypothetical protein